MKKIILALMTTISLYGAYSNDTLQQQLTSSCAALHTNIITSLHPGNFCFILNTEEREYLRNQHLVIHRTPHSEPSSATNNASIMLRLNNAPCCSLPLATCPQELWPLVTHIEYEPDEDYQTRLAHTTLGSFPNLQVVELPHMNITTVTTDLLYNLHHLTHLNLSNNPLHTIPTALQQLLSLENIDLSDCSISELPSQFPTLPVLKTLHLQDNKIRYIPNNFFTTVSQLEILDLDNNTITDLSLETFVGLINLIHLYLRGNPLINIHPDTFNGLLQLLPCTVENHEEMSLEFKKLLVAHIKHLNESQTGGNE